MQQINEEMEGLSNRINQPGLLNDCTLKSYGVFPLTDRNQTSTQQEKVLSLILEWFENKVMDFRITHESKTSQRK